MPVTETPPCQSEACTIQTCLARQGFQQPKCDREILALYACCEKMYSLNKSNPESLKSTTSSACPIETNLNEKLKEMRGTARN
ncbi:hypothetical protein JCM16303_006202 [Sporobolomyces ruberrimus]